MEYSSGDESGISDSEIQEYMVKPYEALKNGHYKVKNVNSTLRCPFCTGKKKQEYGFNNLLQHARGIAKGSSRRKPKQKATHLALARYLEFDFGQTSKLTEPEPKSTTEPEELYCWPWVGIIVNITKDPYTVRQATYSGFWMRTFSKYQPLGVEVIHDDWDGTAEAVVHFEKGWNGFRNAVEFEKRFEAGRHGKKDWIADKGRHGSSIYGWFARVDDYYKEGKLGEYLRLKGELKTLSDVVHEVKPSKDKIVGSSLTKYNEEDDKVHQTFYEEIPKIQSTDRDHIQRITEEQEKMNRESESVNLQHDRQNRELSKVEEKKQNEERAKSLQMASLEQKKADDNVLRLVEEPKREKTEALNKILELEKELDTEQKLEVIKRMGGIDEKTFLNAIKKRFTNDDNDNDNDNNDDDDDNDEGFIKASEGCSESNGNAQEMINEEDEKLKNVKVEWGEEVYKAVLVALQERNEYNLSGSYILRSIKSLKRKR